MICSLRFAEVDQSSVVIFHFVKQGRCQCFCTVSCGVSSTPTLSPLPRSKWACFFPLSHLRWESWGIQKVWEHLQFKWMSHADSLKVRAGWGGGLACLLHAVPSAPRPVPSGVDTQKYFWIVEQMNEEEKKIFGKLWLWKGEQPYRQGW